MIKSNHVKELITTQSVNCFSCGAGLKLKKSDDTTCNCEYCKNTNLILEGGKTKIFKPVPVGKSKPKKLSKVTMTALMIGALCIGVAGVALYMSRIKKEKDKEKKKLNRLLLLSK